MTDDEIRDYISVLDETINSSIEKRDSLWALIRLRPILTDDAFQSAVAEVTGSMASVAAEMGSVNERVQDRKARKALEADASKE